MGSLNLYQEEPGQRDIPVSRVNLHPGFSDWTLDNNICILELAEEADLSEPNIGVIPLPEEGEETRH